MEREKYFPVLLVKRNMDASIFDRPTLYARSLLGRGTSSRTPSTSRSDFVSMVRARGVEPKACPALVDLAYSDVPSCSARARYEEAAMRVVRDARLLRAASERRLAGLERPADERPVHAASPPPPRGGARRGLDYEGEEEEDPNEDARVRRLD